MKFIAKQSNGKLGFEDFVGYEISRLIIQARRLEDFRLEEVPGIVADHLEYLRLVLPDVGQTG